MKTTANYKEFREETYKELNDFIGKNCVWAFGREQTQAKLKELGLTEQEFVNQYVGFMGGAMRKDKVKEYAEISRKAHETLVNALKSNYELAKDAFNYELHNHECFYTSRFSDAFNALGLTDDEVNNDEILLKAFKEAKKAYWDWACENC